MDIDLTLDDSATSSVTAVSCSPAGNGAMYKPLDAFKAFYGEESAGDWVLEIISDDPNGGVITSYELEVLNLETFAQGDTILFNDPGLCSAEFIWTHPIFNDNCCEGTMEVTYEFINDVTGVTSTTTVDILTISGFVDQEGLSDTIVFDVGVTDITYTLTDLAGNEGSCTFTVTVVDNELPVFVSGCNDLTVGLEPGDCSTILIPEPIVATDNCGIESITYCDANGDPIDIGAIPIGINVITTKATDIYGNVSTCDRTVTVLEYIPNSDNLACNNSINLSLGVDCTALVTADMILEGGPYRCYDNYCIEITNAAGQIVDNIFDISDAGQTFTVSVSDCLGSGNSCWGEINVEEKLIPEIECPADIEISCNQDPEARYPIGHPQAGQLLTGELNVITCELGVSITYLDDIFDNGSCGDPVADIIRTWKLVDDEGNVVTCQQQITVLPVDPTLIVFPEHITLAEALSCADVNDNPILTEPDSTGYPTLNGMSLYGDSYCTISLGYWDEVLDIVNCEAGYSILRHWSIQDLCQPLSPGINPIQQIQNIVVTDLNAPTTFELEDAIGYIDPWGCSGTFVLPDVVHDDDCSEYSVDWNVSYGQVIDDVLYNALKGETSIQARVTDACGNSVKQSFTLNMYDNAPPVPVARQNIVINLTTDNGADGVAKLFASSVDKGSFDGCSDGVKIEIRRTEDACDFSGNDTFNADGHPGDGSPNPNAGNYDPDGGEYVKFCCMDIPDGAEFGIVPVEMRVWDDANDTGIYGDAVDNNGDGDTLDPGETDNYNETWVEVRVEGKNVPSIACLPDLTINCDMDYTDPTVIGTPIAIGLCGDEQLTVAFTPQLNACGVGFVIATYGVESNSTVTCSQRITIENQNAPFDPSSIRYPRDLPTSPTGQLTCADDIPFDPPTWTAGPCDFIGYSESVDTFFFELDPNTGLPSDACFKIIRTFTVIDWCLYDDTGGQEGQYFGTQNIKITDRDAPELQNCMPSMYEVDENCVLTNLTLTNNAIDNGDCASDWLKWQVFVDTWGDGIVDYEYSTFVATNTNFNSDSNNNGVVDKYLAPTMSGEDVLVVVPEEIEASEFNHIVTWKVTDGCGNVSSCETTFMVVDKKAPTPYCVSLSSSPMENGQVELWAIDFDLGAFDNCTAQENLRFTFSETLPEDDSNYDADLRSSAQVFSNCGLQEVKVYVFDEAGNYDFCVVTLTLGGEGCEGMDIAGRTATENDNGVSNSLVTIDATIAEYPRSIMTDDNGDYAFLSNPENANYEIAVLKDDNHTNGVSTLDLVLIQRHIVGFAELNSAYKVIAADINRDDKVSSIDVVELRKVILGIQEEFEANTSWRFVDDTQVFPDPMQPFPVDETREIENLSIDANTENFVAVKIGDVNGNAMHNVAGATAEVRSGSTMILDIEDRAVVAGEQVEIAVSSADFRAVSGLQATIEFDGLSFSDILGRAIQLSESNVGVISENVITMSWNTNTAVSTSDVLFVIKAIATKDGFISEMINVTDKVITPEAYQGSDLEISTIELGTRIGGTKVLANELMQNEPNPFKELTSISFHLVEAGKATLTIRDVAGKVIRTVKGEYTAGINTISLSKGDLNVAGLLYYTLESGDFSETRKMIVIE